MERKKFGSKIGAWICTTCSLNCKRCVNYSQVYREKEVHYLVSFEDYCREVGEAMKLHGEVETFSITGGEPFLHPRLADITAYTLREYAGQIRKLRITTNGTLMPSQKLVDTLRQYAAMNRGGVEILIDDYGALSAKTESIAAVLRENQIPCLIKRYHGKDQYLNGWVDLGPLDRFRGYSNVALERIIQRCHYAMWGISYLLKGKLFPCPCAAAGSDLGFFTLAEKEFVDLFDTEQTMEQKMAVITSFGDKPFRACQYCNGFDPECAVRYPAAEQV